MTLPLAATIEGIGLWAPGVPSWDAFAAHCRDGMPLPADAPTRPAPDLLPANERRRAPDTVLVALQAAQAACQAAGRAAETLPSVFASTYGDLAITDHLCATLASAPTEVSPTRFHNSVHNAAAGYWTIGTGARQPATALSAGTGSFALGLLDAMAQLHAGAPAVLLVGYDGASRGALAEVVHSEGLLGVALVLARATHAARSPRLALGIAAAGSTVDAPPAAIAAGNAMAPALALMAALARGEHTATLADGHGGAFSVALAHG